MNVVVVGAGVGGCLAALSAARAAPDADVRVVSTAPGRYELEPGTIDVLGYVDGDGPVERPLANVEALPDDHPYSRLDRSTVEAGLELFDEVLVDDGPYGGGDRNALLPTLDGGFRPAARHPAGMEAGLLSRNEPMRLVGFEEVPGFDADLAASRLDEVAPYEVTSATVECPVDLSGPQPSIAFADALDDDPETEGETAREALANAVRPELDVEPRVGFPAVLGRSEHEAVREELGTFLGADVFEVPLGEPSVPGLRLRERLFARLESEGIDRTPGTVTGFETQGDEIRALTLALEPDGEESTAVDAVVLATGGPAAGGLVGSSGGVVEPAFGCPVAAPSDVLEWSSPDPLGRHRFARFGLDVTDRLRPRDGNGEANSGGDDGTGGADENDGEALYGNLYAAGTILGGHDFVAEGSRGGVALATGYAAGRYAVDS